VRARTQQLLVTSKSPKWGSFLARYDKRNSFGSFRNGWLLKHRIAIDQRLRDSIRGREGHQGQEGHSIKLYGILRSRNPEVVRKEIAFFALRRALLELMLFCEIAITSRRVAETTKRLAKIELLAACLRSLAPDEIEIGVAYLSGVTPRSRIRIGPALIRDAWPKSNAPAVSVSLTQVDQELSRIAIAAGAGSQDERKRLLRALLTRLTQEEQEFLARLLLGELRQGALEGIMVEAIARASLMPVTEVRKAAMLAGGLPLVAHAALTEGAPGLAAFSLRVGHPLLPMLAQPADDVEEALREFGVAGLEWKLDGARVQVHKQGDDVRVFSRSLNDVSYAVPEIVEAAQKLPARELILDGEAIALHASGAPRPFQVTMRRFGRKLNIAQMREALPLSVYFFDCLYLDSSELLSQPARERFRVLSSVLAAPLAIPRLITSDVQQASAFFDDAIRHGHEGVMIKSLDSIYDAGNRGSSWLKIKPAYTLDLVVLAAEWGHGRRSGYLSNLHLGARDPETDQYVMLGKTFKGMTDELLAWQTKRLLELEVARDAYTIYIRPELVVEIAFGDVQASSQYPAGMALRFARIKRYRPDKRPAEADTVESVRAIHAKGQRR
jgi:DNA ligase-1